MKKTSTTPAKLPQIKAAELRTFHRRLLAWYGTHGRHDLPWRTTNDPYAVWVSEVMLQQTQVATVLDRYYFPFLERFPTIQHLAQAPRETVMKAWEGLGYYRRAGFLYEAAKRAHNGLPADAEGLMALPGIGRNTAHAVLAFAHRQPVAILEANVKRVVARIFALPAPSDAALWQGAEMLLNPAEPFDHNQAMMDLGNRICTPRAPDCPACPANHVCRGQHAPQHYPAPKAKKAVPTRTVDILVHRDAQGRLYLESRADALLGGLYGFPQRPATDVPARGEVTHIYSHFRLEGRVVESSAPPRGQGGWYSAAQIATLPLSKLDHKVLALLGHSAAAKRPKARRPRKQD